MNWYLKNRISCQSKVLLTRVSDIVHLKKLKEKASHFQTAQTSVIEVIILMLLLWQSKLSAWSRCVEILKSLCLHIRQKVRNRLRLLTSDQRSCLRNALVLLLKSLRLFTAISRLLTTYLLMKSFVVNGLALPYIPKQPNTCLERVWAFTPLVFSHHELRLHGIGLEIILVVTLKLRLTLVEKIV